MDEKSPFLGGYSPNAISAEAIRERARRESVTALNVAFSNVPSRKLRGTHDLSEVLQSVHALGIHLTANTGTYELSEAYESFSLTGSGTVVDDEFTQLHGIEDLEVTGADSETKPSVESRIMRIKVGATAEGRRSAYLGLLSEIVETPDPNLDSIFLLAMVGDGQQTVRKENLHYGAVKTSDDQTEFFELITLGNVSEERATPFLAALKLSTLGNPIAEQLLVAVPLLAAEEPTLIEEFRKATQALKIKALQPKIPGAKRGPSESISEMYRAFRTGPGEYGRPVGFPGTIDLTRDIPRSEKDGGSDTSLPGHPDE